MRQIAHYTPKDYQTIGMSAGGLNTKKQVIEENNLVTNCNLITEENNQFKKKLWQKVSNFSLEDYFHHSLLPHLAMLADIYTTYMFLYLLCWLLYPMFTPK